MWVRGFGAFLIAVLHALAFFASANAQGARPPLRPYLNTVTQSSFPIEYVRPLTSRKLRLLGKLTIDGRSIVPRWVTKGEIACTALTTEIALSSKRRKAFLDLTKAQELVLQIETTGPGATPPLDFASLIQRVGLLLLQAENICTDYRNARPTPTPTGTVNVTPSATATPSSSPSGTPTPVATVTTTSTPTPSSSSTPTGTATPTSSATQAPTQNPTNSPTPTPSISPPPSMTPTPTPFAAVNCTQPVPQIPATTGTIYYFSASGSDGNSGLTQQLPKRSLSLAPGLLANAPAGTQVLLRRGDVFRPTAELVFSDINGTPTNPIVFGGYGSGARPRIDGNHTNSITVVRGGAAGTSHFWIHGIEFTSSNLPGYRSAGLFVGEGWYRGFDGELLIPQSVRFIDVNVHHLTYGITLFGANTEITDSVISNNFNSIDAGEVGNAAGVFMSGQSFRLHKNLIEFNGKSDSPFDHNIYTGGSAHTITCNRLENSTNAIKIRGGVGTVVANNRFFRTPAAIIAGGDENQIMSNLRIVNNEFTEVQFALHVKSQSLPSTLPISDLTFAGNIIHNTVTSSAPAWLNSPAHVLVDSSEPVQGIYILNNLFFNTDKSLFFIHTLNANPTIVIANNMLSNFTGRPFFDVSNVVLTQQNNRSYTDLATFENQTRLVNSAARDFRLTAQSTTLLNQGTNAYLSRTPQDFRGTARPQNGTIDIGPYEGVN